MIDSICDRSSLSSYDRTQVIVYGILFGEFSFLTGVLSYFVWNSYKDSRLNMHHYRLYLVLNILSSVLKLVMFLDPCLNYGDNIAILILVYDIPFYSGETVLIYIWYYINRRSMALEAYGMVTLLDYKDNLKRTFWYIVIGNCFMYVFLVLIIVSMATYIGNYDDYTLLYRVYKASLELSIVFGVLWSGIRLLKVVKKIQGIVPRPLLIWLIVGCGTSSLKCIIQLLLSFKFITNNVTEVTICVIISYNLASILPTLIFIQSFKIYSKFMDKSLISYENTFSILKSFYSEGIEDKLKSTQEDE
jgi:hypothetical protein